MDVNSLFEHGENEMAFGALRGLVRRVFGDKLGPKPLSAIVLAALGVLAVILAQMRGPAGAGTRGPAGEHGCAGGVEHSTEDLLGSVTPHNDFRAGGLAVPSLVHESGGRGIRIRVVAGPVAMTGVPTCVALRCTARISAGSRFVAELDYPGCARDTVWFEEGGARLRATITFGGGDGSGELNWRAERELGQTDILLVLKMPRDGTTEPVLRRLYVERSGA